MEWRRGENGGEEVREWRGENGGEEQLLHFKIQN